jgi:membrane-associated PAP2 superfamily phosphatase
LTRIFLIGFPTSLRDTASPAEQKETLTSGISFFVLEAVHSINWQLEWAHFPVHNLWRINVVCVFLIDN